MSEQPFQSLEEHFGDLPDPRVVGQCDHNLLDIIIMAIGAALCGAESWDDVEEIGLANRHGSRSF